MTFTDEITQRARDVSGKIASWLDAELYLNDYDDQSENYTLSDLFLKILEMIIEELKDLGIRIQIPTDEIYENSLMISAVMSLREIFDKNNLFLVMDYNRNIRDRLQGILDSVDIRPGEHVKMMIEVLQALDVINAFRYKELYRLEERYSSNGLFLRHVEACIDLVIPKSKATDEAVLQYVQVGKAIALIKKYWDEAFDILSNAGINPIPEENRENYFKQYASAWMDVTKAPTWYWAINLTQDALHENMNVAKAHSSLISKWQSNNTYGIVHVNRTYGLDDLTAIYISQTLRGWSFIREDLRPLEFLLDNGTRIKNGQPHSLNCIFLVYNAIKRNIAEKLSSESEKIALLEWNEKVAAILTANMNAYRELTK